MANVSDYLYHQLGGVHYPNTTDLLRQYETLNNYSPGSCYWNPHTNRPEHQNNKAVHYDAYSGTVTNTTITKPITPPWVNDKKTKKKILLTLKRKTI